MIYARRRADAYPKIGLVPRGQRRLRDCSVDRKAARALRENTELARNARPDGRSVKTAARIRGDSADCPPLCRCAGFRRSLALKPHKAHLHRQHATAKERLLAAPRSARHIDGDTDMKNLLHYLLNPAARPLAPSEGNCLGAARRTAPSAAAATTYSI